MNQNMEQMLTGSSPALTLDPFGQAEIVEADQMEIVETEKQQVMTQEEQIRAILTPEELRQVDAFSAQIDITNSQMVLQYGAGSQKKIADFSQTALNNVRTRDLGEIGTAISAVVTELKSIDEEEDRGFLGIFKKGGNKLAAMKAKYAKAETNVNEICEVLEGHQHQLLKDAAMLETQETYLSI